MEITVNRNLNEANDLLALELRTLFNTKKILVLNLISSPGAGKTSLLEKTLVRLRDEFCFAVIEGDLQTDNDARRIAATGARVVQINTYGGCHLNSTLIKNHLDGLDLNGVDILFIENVGNLVCPVGFDCGEDHKVAVLSVPEGDDKPEKYPLLFHVAKVMILNKTDLLPHVDFDTAKATALAQKLNRELIIFPLSCRQETGLEPWYDWLRSERRKKTAAAQ